MFRRTGITFAVLFALASASQAAPIFVPGPSPVAPFGGTVIDFEGRAEGEIIQNQYAGLGVTFGQHDTGTPMIDNLPALFGYGPGSGVGMLTGSGNGGSIPTTAGIIAFFTSPVSDAGAFMSDTSALGNYTITAFGAGMAVLESFVVTPAQFPGPAQCGGTFFPQAPGCGVFVGFSRGTADIEAIQFGPSAAFGDAFSIDDVRFVAQPGPAPEPATVLLLGLGAAAVLRRRFV